jgi:hypothetical protein
MVKDKLKEIIHLLRESTKSGNLVWSECGKLDKRDFHREFNAVGEDGTKYETEVKFSMSSNGTWQLETSPSLWIRSEKLPNGALYVYGVEDATKQDLIDLRDIIKSKYCSDMNPSEKVVEDALDLISRGISRQEFRETKLNKILNVFGISDKK